MGVPKEIPDFGSAAQRARQNPEFDPTRFGEFTAEDYYVWSRVDGTASLKELILMMGFETAKTIAILRRLRGFGALLMPDETPSSVAIPVLSKNAAGSQSHPAIREDVLDESNLTDQERAALEEDVVLDDAQKRRVLFMMRQARRVDYFTLFGLDASADKRDVKRAYFRLSKEFHPDRFYGKNTGSFGKWLAALFEHLNKAFEVLSNPKKRSMYIAALRGGTTSSGTGEQTKEEYAEQLFERACLAETSGELAEAAQLFRAAVKVHATAKYLRRAATCLITAGELSLAEEYAKKAADLQSYDPSYIRVLADVYRASGNWGEAERILVHALELKTENDVLTSELQADLAEVRRMKGA